MRSLTQHRHIKINTYSSGVSGNNSMHSINILLNKILPLDPQVVVMMHNWNDLIVLLYEGGYWNDSCRSPKWIRSPDGVHSMHVCGQSFPSLLCGAGALT